MSVPSKLELSLSPALVVSVISPPVCVAKVIHSVLPGTKIIMSLYCFPVCLRYYILSNLHVECVVINTLDKAHH